MLLEQYGAVIIRLLRGAGLEPVIGDLTGLSGDGSDRRFFRFAAGPTRLLAVLPAEAPQAGAEAVAAFRLARHFTEKGVPVPRVYGFAEECGLLLFEDLGDLRLHDLVIRHGVASPEVEGWYRRALAALIRLQVDARQGFDPAWCFDTPRYDRELMLERESGYFRRAFCEDLLGMKALPPAFDSECLALAQEAAAQPADFVLHRDFQSRNIMMHADRGDGIEPRVRIIDFQGARLGPLAYDLASLLIDPYVDLPEERRRSFLEAYLDLLETRIELDRDRFLAGYYPLALQRNLQILGAFAFLSARRGKVFFQAFIPPALRSLKALLDTPWAAGLKALRQVAEQAETRFYGKNRQDRPCRPDIR